ncbi:UvrD/REP helicase domain protein [Synechococcus sp. PCC 7335]|uniref:3'-5' exonuclease n=1 Tax=Synechococcus sp. (strain ATCC 29403 / PCC 7335) TaxID=91464 RepID=UPI00017EE115|nr:3'-5' exonuclease [Synechococcus sp. PCC 7335]EDX83266.1 UvrD/REP helicase domain protein [Synechococcus sp. PCC 7335]
MAVLIDQALPSAVSRLAAKEAKRVWTFLTKFLENPAHPSLSLERITKTNNKNLWSARISQELRAVIYKDGETWTVLHADHHDAAYHWAETKQIARHSKTGALQIIASPEVVEQQIQSYDQRYDWSKTDNASSGIFDEHKDDYLLSLGVPAKWVPTLRKIKLEEVLIDAVLDLPNDVGERLLCLAAGEFVTPPTAIPAEQPLIEQQDVKRRFFVLKDSDDLLRMLEAPLETWIAFLHPSQEQLATGDFSGPVKVTGSAGTGKTVVAMHRARHLARQGKKVLLTSYVKTLCENIERNLDLLCTSEEKALITVSTVHKQALRLATSKGQKLQPVEKSYIKSLIETAHFPSCPLDPVMLLTEWETVIQDQGITRWEQYKSANRAGRGFPLSAKGREQIWPIFERMIKTLEAEGKAEWSSICRQAREFVVSGVVESPFDAVVVDELQDLQPQEIQLLGALAGKGRNTLMLVGDGGQRIYGGRFSLKGLGVNVQGRSHILRINYRTTEQIRRFADKLVGESGDDLDGGLEKRKGTVSLLKGPQPVLHPAKTQAQQWKYVAGEIKRMKKEGLDLAEMAIFSRTNADLQTIQAALTRNKVKSQIIAREGANGDGVRLGTLHRAKGLEFKSVFVVNVSDEQVPQRSLLQDVQDQQLRSDLLERERQLLYVGLTRARDEAILTWVGYPSRFLEDILTDPELEALEESAEK